MSVIAGILQLDSAPACPAELECVLRPLQHRAPDGTGAFCAGPVALGHGLMSITLESAQETSPWRSLDGQRVITFDGRLDHRDDLCAALGLAPVERGLPDPELILRAWERWGTDGVARLEGEFAFAAWDGRQQQLLCARSILGDREFYYHVNDRRLVFASMIRGVLAGPEVPRELNELHLGCQLGGVPRPADGCLYAGIQRLPGGRLMLVQPGRPPQVRAFWQFSAEPILRLRSPAEYAETLRELLDRAVRSALRTRHPVAAMCSGGLDSTGVAVLAARELAARGQRMTTVSTMLPPDFQGEERSREETEFVHATLAMYPTMDPRWALGLKFPVLEFADDHYLRRDVPVADAKSFRTAELARLAETAGARVLLGGMGGDMAASFTGGGYLEHLARTGRWLELVRQLQGQARARGSTVSCLFRNEVVRPCLPPPVLAWWDHQRGRSPAGVATHAIHPDLAARIGLAERRRALGHSTAAVHDHRPLHLALANAGQLGGGGGWSSQQPGCMEWPQPLNDRRLWDWCHRVPLAEFVRDGMPRSLFRRALHDALPEKILRRTSKGWYAPDYRLRLAACRPAMLAFLAEHPANDRMWTYLHRPTVEAAVQQLAQPESLSPGDPRLQTVLCTDLRLAHFVDWFHRTARG